MFMFNIWIYKNRSVNPFLFSFVLFQALSPNMLNITLLLSYLLDPTLNFYMLKSNTMSFQLHVIKIFVSSNISDTREPNCQIQSPFLLHGHICLLCRFCLLRQELVFSCIMLGNVSVLQHQETY